MTRVPVPRSSAELWSVDFYVGRFRKPGEGTRELYARALGAVEGTANDNRIDDAERVRQIRNVIAAVNVVQAEIEAASEAIAYCRGLDCAGDPTPVSPARGGPLQVGTAISGIAEDGRREGEPVVLVDPTGPACSGVDAAAAR